MKIRLSFSQKYALACRDWTTVVLDAWKGGYLYLPEDDYDREQLWRELRDASNAEDIDAHTNEHPQLRIYARRTALSLDCLAYRVIAGNC